MRREADKPGVGIVVCRSRLASGRWTEAIAGAYLVTGAADVVYDRAHHVGHNNGYGWAQDFSFVAALPRKKLVAIFVCYVFDRKGLHVNSLVGKDTIGRD